MAPEQVQDAPGLDHRCDLYALGCVAYELLTGHALFEAEDVNGMLAAQVRNPVVPPSRHRPDLPDDLERVVLRLLAKDPADRYPDAASVALALASCATPAPGTTRRRPAGGGISRQKWPIPPPLEPRPASRLRRHLLNMSRRIAPTISSVP